MLEQNAGVMPEVHPTTVLEFNLELNAEITEHEVLKKFKSLKVKQGMRL